MPKTPSMGIYRFVGFVAPRYTPTPDELFDDLLAPGVLTEAELRVLLYIVRRTFGWKKDSDAISLSQLTGGIVRRTLGWKKDSDAISLSQLTGGIVRRDGTRLDWGAGVRRPAAVRAIRGL